jgi:hypothetical protein
MNFSRADHPCHQPMLRTYLYVKDMPTSNIDILVDTRKSRAAVYHLPVWLHLSSSARLDILT